MILKLHYPLSRFSYEGMWRRKLQTIVDYSATEPLNLKNYRYANQNDTSNGSYDLYGVVNHYGTMEGGHYIAYCKNAHSEKWYKYDDHDVTEMNAYNVQSQAAYILFYTARNYT